MTDGARHRARGRRGVGLPSFKGFSKKFFCVAARAELAGRWRAAPVLAG